MYTTDPPQTPLHVGSGANEIVQTFKGIAARADLVSIGRMHVLALAAAGQAGVARFIELLDDEVRRSMMQLGVTSFKEFNGSYLRRTPPANGPQTFSAFPLLKIENYAY